MANCNICPMKVGENIRRVRQSKGYSQEYLAQKLGVSQNFIHKIEANKKNASIEDLKQLAIVLETPISELLGAPLYQENHNSTNSSLIGTYTIHHHFPAELMEVLKKIADNI